MSKGPYPPVNRTACKLRTRDRITELPSPTGTAKPVESLNGPSAHERAGIVEQAAQQRLGQ